MGETTHSHVGRGSRTTTRWPIALVVIALGALLPVPASAQSLANTLLRNSFNPVGAGARGTGMGGAFIAVADDGTAASFNPAGLTQLRRPELAVVTFNSALASTTRETFWRYRTLSDKLSHTVPEFVGFAIPLEYRGRPTTLQLSYQCAVDFFGRGNAYVSLATPPGLVPPGLLPEEYRSNPPEIRWAMEVDGEQKGALHTVTMSVAHELSDKLSVGVALNTWIGRWRAIGVRRSDHYGETEAGPLSRPFFLHQFDQRQDLRGTNLNMGFLFRHSRFALGGVLRTPFDVNYRLDEEGYVPLLNGVIQENPYVRDTMRTTLRWPRSAGLGAAYHPAPGLTLVADYTRTMWSRAVIENLPNGALLTDYITDAAGNRDRNHYSDRNFFDLYSASQTKVQDAGAWRFGIEYMLNLPRLVVPLRAGVFRDRSPIYDLLTSESRRINGFSFGTGLSFDHVVLDVAYERRTNNDVVGVTASGTPLVADGAIATESTDQRRLVASLIVRFGRRTAAAPRRAERERK